MKLLTVNLGQPTPSEHTQAAAGNTGIDKRPVDGPVAVTAPGPKGTGGSGLAGDAVVNLRHHGGDDQAVYAYAREDLDDWQRELGRELANGSFGENLTTSGVEVTGALIGERWRVGPRLLLEVSCPRVPCQTFQGWLGEHGWLKRFTQAAVPGAYLRVIESGEIRAEDAVELVHRPAHEVSIRLMFQALTTRRELLPRLLEAGGALPEEARRRAETYMEREKG
ncbi:MOSC domain-containing protein [Streptomyces sioyaensis]|uniref:MOSC domain-containing protein n=1 Tax=Streptomyces sioyaensis TaxID=67364 RepID=UPI00365B12F1